MPEILEKGVWDQKHACRQNMLSSTVGMLFGILWNSEVGRVEWVRSNDQCGKTDQSKTIAKHKQNRVKTNMKAQQNSGLTG